MGFSKQEYWSGVPFPSPGYLPDPGIEPGSPTLQADALTSVPPGKLKEDRSGGKFGPLFRTPATWLTPPLLLADSAHLSAGLCLLVQHDFSTLICARDLVIL